MGTWFKFLNSNPGFLSVKKSCDIVLRMIYIYICIYVYIQGLHDLIYRSLISYRSIVCVCTYIYI